MTIRLSIGGNRSLKGKRRVIRPIVERVRAKFGAAVAEVGEQDSWQSALLGVAVVGNDRRRINASLDKIVNYIENLNIAEIRDYEIEITNLSGD